MTVAILIFVGTFLGLFFWGRSFGGWKLVVALLLGWLIKCAASFGFYYVYSDVYGKGELTEDAGAYIREAKILNTIFKESTEDYFNVILNRHDYEKTIIRYFKHVKISRIGPPSFLVNDTRNQIKLISLVSLVIGEDALSLFSFFALISFLGLLVLWKSLAKRSSIEPILIFGLLLIPISLLFWTSSPLKETTSMFGLSIFLAAVIRIDRTKKWIIIGSIGLLSAWAFKPYLVVILGLSYFLIYTYRKIISEKKWSYGLTLIALGVLLFFFSIPKKILHTVSDKQFDFVNVARGGVHMEGDTCFYFLEKINRNKITITDSMVTLLEPIEMIAIEKGKIRREQKFTLHPNGEKLRFEYEQFGGSSFFETRPINRNWGNLLLAIPESIINTFFRPFAWTNFFSIQNSILFLENLIFILALVHVLRKFNSINNRKIQILISVICLTSLLFSILIGLTTPVSGAIVRYRIPIHLFILVSLILIHSKNESKTG